MQSRYKLTTAVFTWTIGVLALLIMAPFSNYAFGALFGAVGSALVFGLAVKWGAQSVVEQAALTTEEIQEQIAPDRN
jgi:hypothetical protein